MLGDSDSESSSSSLDLLKVNEDYAAAYARRKEREELSRLKDKYGSDGEDESNASDSESESEDEYGEELTPAVDAAILRTLARIRRKDPEIYEMQRNVFQEERERTSSGVTGKKSKKGKDKEKPLTLKQHALNAVLAGSRSPSPIPAQATHVEEQRALRDETIRAFARAADEEGDEFLVPREKTKDELEREEEEYRAFLEREVGVDIAELVDIETEEQAKAKGNSIDDEPVKVKKKKKTIDAHAKDKSKTRKDEDDQNFLLDYILNRGWIDKSERRVPTYKEVTSKSAHKDRSNDQDSEDTSDENVDADSDAGSSVFEEAAEHFEEAYQFRYQEPGAATIGSHPRKISTLVRREDTRRKEARERRHARKEEEKLQKREEVKRLKALKLKEMRRRLERIGREGGKGADDKALEALDLDADWDPDKHDAQMADMYGEDEDGNAEIDEEKPEWEDDIDIDDLPTYETKESSKKKKKRKRGADEDAAAVDLDMMDADVQQQYDPDEQWDGTEEMRKRKLQQYVDELDEMEFNDLVGGIPTRFKYTSVGADDFGLTPAEILMATDAELNQYVGVKRYAPYRKQKWDTTRGDRLREFRQKLKERGGAETEDAPGEEKKKRKGKKERMREKAAIEAKEAAVGSSSSPKKKKKRKAQSNAED